MENLKMYEMIEISGGRINTNDGYHIVILFAVIDFFDGIREGFNAGYTRAIQ